MNITRSTNSRWQINPEIFPPPHRPTTRQSPRGVFLGSNIHFGRNMRESMEGPRSEIASQLRITGSSFGQRIASNPTFAIRALNGSGRPIFRR